MTLEHKLIFGLGEIRGIVLQCSRDGCSAKAIVSPDQLDSLPQTCPRGHSWDWNIPHQQYVGSPFHLWMTLLQMLRNPLAKDVGFKILLEIDEPK